jgi:integrase
MTRQLHLLTARTVAGLKDPGRYADGGNLYLRVSPTGAKRWTFLYTIGTKKNRELGLGSAGTVTLAEAREKATAARKLLVNGIDPKVEKREEEAAREIASVSFGDFADAFIKDHEAGWSNPKHIAQWHMTLSDSYCKKIRSRPISEIHTDDVLAVLKPCWQTRPETARRIRMRIEKVLDAAKVKGLRTGENPARSRGQLDHILPRHTKSTDDHHNAMPYGEVPAFLASLEQKRGFSVLALRFAILTAARTGEVIGARWEEIDMEAGLWTIPAQRMKARRAHRVPLTDPVLEVLREVQGAHAEWVFPGPSLRAPLSNMAMLGLLKRAKLNFTVHGFRSGFRDWSAETTNFPSEVCEMALAHAVANKTEAAYRRGDLFEKRKALMEAWAGFLTEPKASNVVQLKKVAK